MGDWTNRLAQIGSRIDDRFDALKHRLRQRAGSYDRLQVLAYRGFGNSAEFYLKGRVLREREAIEPVKTRIWHNVLATYRRFHSVEIPNAMVRVSCGGEVLDVLTDKEGYFELHLKNVQPAGKEPWHDIQIELRSPTVEKPEGSEAVKTVGKALVPPMSARFAIISDIDDTILVTNATNLLKVAYSTFLRNARGRVAFPGVAAFYRALQKGTNETELNPIFYVSSGPWNLYDLLVEFMQLNDIPPGPILLQDYGVDDKKLFSASHRDHKMAQIRKIMETYPDLPFVLVGDSGQHDPEIYRQVLEEVPARVKAIYIRDVTEETRDVEVRMLAEEAKAHGGELLLVENSLQAAQHAVEKGLISAAALPEIAGEKREDEQAATQSNADPKIETGTRQGSSRSD